ncbi:dihydropteroate synthase [Flavimaricola marinus]|uniref:Dihydropteroate synthase n=1 Tax=Flavimaricola marinus TaxID=1819565 RepID=A0A238LIF7_9RHOB|nr:dihydropteroate synthase [Flavimaricola marinus]SMY08660.1 Dihydropteroate synthase [Flavimaricola marinus]
MIVARSGIRSATSLPLAGSKAVWFEPDQSQSTEDHARQSSVRAPLCGLTLDRPRIMGILNVTPDSFSDGGTLDGVMAAVERARRMAQSADILDIGGESTRPGAAFVPVSEEIRRTVPVIRAIREAGITTPISIDTRKAAVADAALQAGADIVNDVSGLLFDPEMAACVAQAGAPVCIMHAKGTPETMQNKPHYDDVLAEVIDHLGAQIEAALSAGIAKDRIITDPGIGFGKTLQHNVTLLRGLAELHDLGCPILLGASRKGFIGTIGGAEVPSERSPGSVAVALHGVSQGVQILRVHDTADTKQALSLYMAIVEQ